MEYSHTQQAPLHYFIYAVAAVLIGLAWRDGGDSPAAVVAMIAAVVIVFFGLCFRTMTVSDEGQRLSVCYGPIPLFRTSITYADISRVEAGRSSLIDGWGIHYLPGRGWTYNLWGFGCAVVYLEKRLVRIGSDDVDSLVAFLTIKTGATNA